MIELVFGLFIVGGVAVLLVLLLDLLARGHGLNRNYVGATLSSITYLTFLYLGWRLWLEVQGQGEASFSVVSGPLSSAVHVSAIGIYVFGIAAILGFIVSLYSVRSLANYRNAAIFYSLIILLGISIFGVVVAGDLLTLFIFWEGMSICAYGLVSFRKSQSEALEAAIKYLMQAGLGSLAALFGIAVVYYLTGTLNLQALSSAAIPPSAGLLFALALIITGFGVEAAIVPLHTWLPDAYPAAPSPASALLAGIVTEIGAFTIIRVIAGSFLSQTLTAILQPILVVLAVATMFVGNLSAYGQDDIKRLLAFSGVAQVGYIFLGISTFTAAGISASIFHIWNHAFLKSLFFLLAGIISISLGTRSLNDMAGIGRKMPLLGLLLSVNAVAMTGMPPFGLFWSEFLLILSALQVNNALLFTASILMLVNIAFSIGYYFRIIRRVAFDKPSEYLNKTTLKPGSTIMIIPCIGLLALSLLTGFFPDMFYQPALNGVRALIGG